MTGSAPLLEIHGLHVGFQAGPLLLPAVRGVDLALGDGETLGLVGESGSGKSVTMMAVMGLLPQNARLSGSIRFRSEEILGLNDREMRPYRGKRIGMIFQDPMTTLNPLLTIGEQIAEAIRIHDRSIGRRAAWNRAIDLLDQVSIPAPAKRAQQYPHEFSGGMRQRAVIAMAIANDPELLIADEPTTALDVTIQAQIMELLKRLCEERHMGMVLVTHDLGVVAGTADSIAVMYAGRIVEHGPVGSVLTSPHHPYSMALLDSLPRLDERVERLAAIPGAPPSLAAMPSGCAFHPRCAMAIDRCRLADPPLRQVGDARVACLRVEELAEQRHRREVSPC
jgi:peptide/nickel transport system ATP-binding protein